VTMATEPAWRAAAALTVAATGKALAERLRSGYTSGADTLRRAREPSVSDPRSERWPATR
jgi:hypothetical protein